MFVHNRLWLLLTVCLSGCIPTPQTDEQTVPVLLLLEDQRRIAEQAFRNQDCLIAGVSRTIPSSGVLVCIRNYGDNCRGDLRFEGTTSRNALISQINAISSQHLACSTAATNAIQQINLLSLPAQLPLYTAGGTAGPHQSSVNYAVRRVASCESVGMQATTFLGGATALADEGQMDFLATPRGLVAIQDTVGTCRSALGLTPGQSSTVAALLAGTLTRTAICDYGSDDGTMTDCPASLDHSDFRFTGISSW
ncbi:hypothetical protein [Leptonema illini]|uniref:Uncharacterized protein n=1 Tax=Leptonema illini DSM 21528 TaxID=929563 RepID=H2CH65_9LEPT|nr:hypothetical protein [Leptonema illini]EHQ06935.1 hypothetical protein Lepil_2259 [Leptonema illini DSM 21528]